MALDQSALLEVLDALKVADVGDRVRAAAETIYQALIEAELTETIGAAAHERTESRTAQRNGHRTRILSTTSGDLELRIPKLRTGSFFPSLLERRRRVDQALFAVVMEAYLHGTSTRKVDDLVKALGADTGISKSEVSRICADLDTEVRAFRDRPTADRTTIPVAIMLDGKCLRGKCEEDHELGYELVKRLVSVLGQRLDEARFQLADVYGVVV
jgi:putative transposase